MQNAMIKMDTLRVSYHKAGDPMASRQVPNSIQTRNAHGGSAIRPVIISPNSFPTDHEIIQAVASVLHVTSRLHN
jgi:hypothetical protein